MNKANVSRSGAALLVSAGLVSLVGATAHAQESAAKPVAPASAPTGHTMTLAQVVDAAAKQNPDLVIARTAVTASERKVKSIKARRFPVVNLEANLFRWDKELSFEFMIPNAPPGSDTSSTIRDQYTSTITARAVQPLSGLLVISKLIKAEKAGLRAAHADIEAARLDVASHAARAFLGTLQARELRSLATESIAQLDAQLEQARALASVGQLDQVDVMRLDAAKASAEQELAAMEAAVRDADEGVLLILGLPLSSAFEPVNDFPEDMPALEVDEGQAETVAMQRPSLRAADERATQALGARDLAKANLFPNINAILQADHNEGQGTFASKNSWFIGVTLSWTIWDWGTNWNDMKAADAQAHGARLQAQRAREQVTLQVRSALRAASAAHRKLDAAGRGAAAAQEAYRIQSVRYKEGALTTTDLLSAQVDLTRARGALTLARYEYLSALVSLERAMGRTPHIAPTTSPEGSK